MKDVILKIGTGLCAVSAACTQGQRKQEASEKMNIVLLLADDLRWNSLGCMGNSMLQTRNIDNLAGNGIRFTNAHVTTSISMVSRASILTGQYMSRHGIREFGKNIPEEAFGLTYPAILRKDGYWSGFVGKYGVGTIRPGDFDFAREYERVHWFPSGNGDSIHVTKRNEKDALEFLANRPKDKPFLLSVSFFATHAQDNHPDQYLYQPESEKYYANDIVPVPETASDEYFKRLPPFIASDENEGRIRWNWRFNTPEKYQKYMKAYYRMLTEMDAAIGAIVEELKKQGVYDNTLIIFTGDNGYFHGEHGLADKWYPYEESIRVPLVIFDPRVKSDNNSRVIDDFVLNIDIAPSIVAAAGLTIPESMQGKDISGLYLSGKKPVWRKDFYYEHPFVTNEKRIPSSEALVTRSAKYILYPHYEYEEFFDLLDDPFEKSNRMGTPENEKVVTDLKLRFEELRRQAK